MRAAGRGTVSFAGWNCGLECPGDDEPADQPSPPAHQEDPATAELAGCG